MINLYGATEVSVDSTWWPVSHSTSPTALIGMPMANQTTYVVDDRLRPLPVGVFGEIVLGGKCVSRGYAGLPELTAQRFVAAPFADATHAKLYRTGDIGRWCADGTLELRGRADTQVKLRGVRIELMEIDETLKRIPQVTEAASTLDERGGAARLTAYVTTAAPATEAELRDAAAALLPSSMLPDRIASCRTSRGSPAARSTATPCRRSTRGRKRSDQRPDGHTGRRCVGVVHNPRTPRHRAARQLLPRRR